MAAPDVGTGTTILFGTSAFSANLLSIDWSRSRGFFETSHMGTTVSHAYAPNDLVDNGEITCEYFFDGGDDPPIDAAAEPITIDWAGEGINNKWAASGFVIAVNPSAPHEDRMVMSMTIKITGGVTLS